FWARMPGFRAFPNDFRGASEKICLAPSIRRCRARREGETRLIAVLANPMENVEMTVTTLFSDDVEFVSTPRAATNHVANAFAATARAVTAWRAERARRLALNDLLAMEPHRLR